MVPSRKLWTSRKENYEMPKAARLCGLPFYKEFSVDKEYKKFLIAFITEIVVVAVMVILMILANKNIIPSIFQHIALICVIICVVAFNIFANKYRKK